MDEHASMRSPRYSEVAMHCPLVSGSICLWCCLHISNLANPMKRTQAVDNAKGYSEIATIARKKDLDEVWSYCSKCSSRA